MKKPEFQLTSVFSDGHIENPQIHQINELPWDTKTSRRGFLSAGLTAAAMLSILGSSDSVNSRSSNEKDGILFAHSGSVLALTITNNNKFLISYGAEGIIKIWSLINRSLLKTISTINHEYSEKVFLKITPDDKYLVMFSESRKSLYTWELNSSGNSFNRFPKSNDNNLLVSAFEIYNNTDIYFANEVSDSPTIYKLSLESGNIEPFISDTKQSKIWDLKFWKNKNIMISGGNDGSIKFWEIPTGKLIKTFWNFKNRDVRMDSNAQNTQIILDEKNEILVSKSNNSIFTVWSLPKSGMAGSLIDKVKLPFIDSWKSKYPSSRQSALLTPGMDTLFLGNDEGEILSWNMPDGSNERKFKGHLNNIESVVITTDGNQLITCSRDKAIKIWDLDKRELISYLSDPNVNQNDGISYNLKDKFTGRLSSYTLPCGSPIPPGAICTCNCVQGIVPVPKSNSGGTYCSCNQVCTCVPVYGYRRGKY